MPKSVMLGDEWFVYSMSWLKKWEDYVYFDLIDQTKPSSDNSDDRPHPGSVDCSDITLPDAKTLLKDPRQQYALASRGLKPKLSEGKDFMLVDRSVHDIFEQKYGFKDQCEPIPRYGIKCSDEEVIVELYLKRMNIIAIPNSKVFNIFEPHFIYVSRNETLKSLELKL